MPPLNRLYESAPLIPGTDFFNIQLSTTNAGAADYMAFAWMSESMPAKDRRPCRTVRATTNAVGVTGTWQAGTLTLTDNIPGGRYALVGAAGFGTNLIAARFLFPGQTKRPGFLAQQAATQFELDECRRGNMGTWGEFENEALPTVEIMSNGATVADFQLFLDIVPLNVRGVG
jgi:hypothetical protein